MRTILLLLCFFSYGGTATAQKISTPEVDKAVEYYKRGDFKNAYSLFEKEANNGNSYAEFSLGFLYENGEGVEQNFTIAAEWYLKAAKKGNYLAEHNLGIMYENGDGVEHNNSIAVEWYRKSAEKGYDEAQRWGMLCKWGGSK